MNHSVHLRAEGEIKFRSKHPLEPAHSLTLLTNADREVISSSEKEWGGYYALRGSLVTGWRNLGAGGRL